MFLTSVYLLRFERRLIIFYQSSRHPPKIFIDRQGHLVDDYHFELLSLLKVLVPCPYSYQVLDPVEFSISVAHLHHYHGRHMDVSPRHYSHDVHHHCDSYARHHHYDYYAYHYHYHYHYHAYYHYHSATLPYPKSTI